MSGFLKHMGNLLRLGAGLKRYGALEALKGVDVIPPGLLRYLRVATAFIPQKSGLPKDPGLRLAQAFDAMGPAYIKLGQSLATRSDIMTTDLTKGLATLQDQLPPFGEDKVKALLFQEFGKSFTDLFDSFDPVPVAAASIAQVHKARTSDGRDVAIKLLRPGIEDRFNRDLDLFDWLAVKAERYSLEARRLKTVQIAQTVRETVEREMDLRLEAANADELARTMIGESGYHVPSIDFERSTRRVLTLEWINGTKLTQRDQLVAEGHNLTLLAHNLVTSFLLQALRDGYFHADLHQGNFLVQPCGTLVAVDFGIMGRLGRKERFFLAESLYGMILRDYRRVAEVHFEVGYVSHEHDIDAFASALKLIGDPIMDKPIDEISAAKLLAQLFATTERFGMQTQPQLLLLQRAMVMAEGLALYLDPGANMWTIARPTLEMWMRDNLSPEVKLADMILKLPRMFRFLPKMLDKWLTEMDHTLKEASFR